MADVREMSTASPEVTRLLDALSSGHQEAYDALLPVLYDELHQLAQAELRRHHGLATLNATGLVHEAYLKLVGSALDVHDRAHFCAVAARAMRQVIVNYATYKRAQKRGGDLARVTLSDDACLPNLDPQMVLALDEALQQLERLDARQCRIVECRFFTGLSVEETAAALAISPRTVKRDWRMARAWLSAHLAA